ncbi:ROK family transcriptional regulator [Microbacterium sp. SORGH_AS_0888]|uniref:ROK family transcriptional regulator n=1 Tax=Microbacterium sp. SORGH_AS_0888 TaxID=3041791 RepID=UPI00277FDEDA|nr:ROK family transcriptional regulator [Microbacterium sp. SORGH_AS_0888]MDQ1129450.1 putative NBD/HSP70 family sugar kinase [Microbacterium sp. SORGH_AS_0888]
MSASADTTGMRRRNLSLVLGLIHREGPLARAALTERTGLNRSTTADLVAELERQGLVSQSGSDPARRVGRPSPLVHASPDVVAVAANPEVDALTMARVGLDRVVRDRVRLPFDAPPTAESAVAAIAAQLTRWAPARTVGIGLAVPGLVRAGDGLVRDAPHLGWHDVPLRDLVEAATGIATAVGNDATLGARAEHLFGAARDAADVVYLNGGASGIGGGLIVGGMPVGGAGGYAGEFGQNRPGIEDAADRRVPGGVLEDEVNRDRLLAAAGLGASDDAALAAALAGASDRTVRDEIARQRRILATALANAVNVLNPSVVVLGGFLAMLAERDPAGFVDEVRAQSMPACAEDLDIRSASLADDRLLVGAAELAFAPLLASPSGT